MWRPDIDEILRSGEKRMRRLREHGADEAAAWVREHLPALRRAAPPPPPPLRPSILLPAVIAAAGAGAAVWWWTQWARGRAEAQRAALDAEGGAAGAAHPEGVMAHNAEPSPATADTPSADAGVDGHAAEVMAHRPPTRATPSKASAGAKAADSPLMNSVSGATLNPSGDAHLSAGAASLDETLTAKPKRARKPKPGEATA